MILELGKNEFNASCSCTYGQSLIQMWKENSEVRWSYELRIVLLSYGAIFPMENSKQKFSNQQDTISHKMTLEWDMGNLFSSQ